MNIEKLKAQLERHEGKSLKPYEDTAKPPKLTIGVGRNLTDNGITEAECALMLDYDVKIAQVYAAAFEWFDSLDEVRQNVIAELIFNIGPGRLAGFKKMIAAIEKQDWDEAADQMIDSKWATQVHNRAIVLSEMMRSGNWPST